MLIFGIIVAAGGIALFFVGKAQAGKALDIESTPTSTAQELAVLAQDVAKEIGAGSFNQIAEVKGIAVCQQPLSAEMSGTKCVHYSCSVTREYEERVWETDSEGRKRESIRRGSETVSSNARSMPFQIEDSTGKVNVDPEGASFVTEKTFSSFEQGGGGGRVQFGGFSIDLGSFTPASGRRTLGYRFEENSIPLGKSLYVLGEAVDEGGTLMIRKPVAKGGRFIVSLKSEEALLASAKTASKWLNVAAIVCVFGGIALVIAGIFGGS